MSPIRSWTDGEVADLHRFLEDAERERDAEIARARRLCEAVVLLDKTPAYSYEKGRKSHVDADGNAPESGRWLTPREMAQSMIRALDAGTPPAEVNA